MLAVLLPVCYTSPYDIVDMLAYCHLSGERPTDHTALRSLSALIASLPASEHIEFREEFDKVCTVLHNFNVPVVYPHVILQEHDDVQLTAYLAALTKSANVLNDVSPPSSLTVSPFGSQSE